MTKKQMTREEEYEFYAKPENQEPQGPARRRKRPNLTEMVPVDGAQVNLPSVAH
jgi:hypothetical protein